MPFAIAKKEEMTQVFDDKGRAFAVTKVSLLDLRVSGVLKSEKNGYDAVQVEVVEENEKKQKKALKAEFHTEAPADFKIGDKISYDEIVSGDTITVVGTGKGKGFAGVIKRHGFHRGPMGHGSNHHRAPGSIGGGYPQRVVAGRKMPGRLGAKQVTISNLEVFDIDAKAGKLLIKGSVPGPRNAKLRIIVANREVEVAVEETAAVQE
jgi:large subunit ribosomal protein L3